MAAMTHSLVDLSQNGGSVVSSLRPSILRLLRSSSSCMFRIHWTTFVRILKLDRLKTHHRTDHWTDPMTFSKRKQIENGQLLTERRSCFYTVAALTFLLFMISYRVLEETAPSYQGPQQHLHIV